MSLSRKASVFASGVSASRNISLTRDLDFTNVMAFEGIPQRLPIKEAVGIADFVETDTRNKRRELLDGFWFD